MFLSKDNYDILDDELHKNFNMEIKDIKKPSDNCRHTYQVRVLPPPRKITLKRVWHAYTLHEKDYSDPVDFHLQDADLSKYASIRYESDTLAHDTTVKEKNIDYIQDNMRYSAFTLAGEIARYMNISCVLASKILRESVDGVDTILDTVNRYNAVIDDYVVPAIFHALFEVTSVVQTEDRDVVFLREPKDAGYYEFSAKDDLVVTDHDQRLLQKKRRKASTRIPTALIQFLSGSASGSILKAIRSKRCILPECLPQIRGIFLSIITILNLEEFALIIRISLPRWRTAPIN